MPQDAFAHYQLGALQIKREDFESARDSLLAAIQLSPNFSEAHMAIAKCCLSLNDREAAIAAYIQAAKTRPDWFPPHVRLAKLYRADGKIHEALHHFREAHKINPRHLRTVLGIGSILEQLGKNEEAVGVYQGYLDSNPPNIWLLNNVANLRLRAGHLYQAIAGYREALQHAPDSPHVYNNLANALYQTGIQENIEEAFECYRKCVELDPSDPISLSNMCMSMHYFDHFSLSEVRAVAERASRRHQRHEFALADIDFNPQRKIRVGYVSADLRSHSVAFFLSELWAEHDHDNFEIHAYSTHPRRDAMTEKLESLVDHWHPVFNLTSEEFAGKVRDDQIDILIDLSGFTQGHRLGTFALKPAPIQITWLGYFGTTGLPEMDYIIADRFVVPENHDHYYAEKIWRMPNSYLCYSAPGYDIPLAATPALANGFVTFGCFNNRSKVSDAALELWARILIEVPNSVLFLKYRQYEDQDVRQSVIDKLSEYGIEGKRIRFEGHSPHPDIFFRYHQVDIALDPFPFGGGTTTAEALWMGVPVVSLLGDRWVGRVSASILHAAGADNLVARDKDDYVRIARELAGDIPALAGLKSKLRLQVENSPLCDAPQFARDFEAGLRHRWRDLCKRQAPTSR